MQTTLKTHVKPREMQVFLWGITALILVDILAKFNIVNMTAFNSQIITLTASLFILISVGILQIINKVGKGTDVIRLFGAIVAVMALASVILGLFNISLSFLTISQGFVDIALGIYVIIEIFR